MDKKGNSAVFAEKISMNRCCQEKGIALVEIIISLAVGVIVVVSVSQFFVHQLNTFTLHEQVAEMHQNGRLGLEIMLKEIKMAGYDPADTANAGIVTANATSFNFTSDLNGNGNTNDPDDNVTYNLYDSDSDGDMDLGRSTDGGVTPEVVAENLQGLSFNYMLSDGSMTTTPADLTDIRRVDVSVTTRTEKSDPYFPTNSGYRTWTVSGTALLRNLDWQAGP